MYVSNLHPQPHAALKYMNKAFLCTRSILVDLMTSFVSSQAVGWEYKTKKYGCTHILFHTLHFLLLPEVRKRRRDAEEPRELQRVCQRWWACRTRRGRTPPGFFMKTQSFFETRQQHAVLRRHFHFPCRKHFSMSEYLSSQKFGTSPEHLMRYTNATTGWLQHKAFRHLDAMKMTCWREGNLPKNLLLQLLFNFRLIPHDRTDVGVGDTILVMTAGSMKHLSQHLLGIVQVLFEI